MAQMTVIVVLLRRRRAATALYQRPYGVWYTAGALPQATVGGSSIRALVIWNNAATGMSHRLYAAEDIAIIRLPRCQMTCFMPKYGRLLRSFFAFQNDVHYAQFRMLIVWSSSSTERLCGWHCWLQQKGRMLRL